MLIFLKLGGSLITDKDNPHTPRPEIIDRLAQEIQAARLQRPEIQIVLGHGSGSFGHQAAKKYRTRQGVRTPQEWMGFCEVWQEARALNDIVLNSLHLAGLPVIAFPASAAAVTNQGRVTAWDIAPLAAALQNNLVPLVFGDVVFDTALGGTILSTEDIFGYLATFLRPQRILLAGLEPGVWMDFPIAQRLAPRITPDLLPGIGASLQDSASVDVTGGMGEKVRAMLVLAQSIPGLEALIYSGLQPGSTTQALLGGSPGTVIALK